jgi:outer membrane protein TolC
VQQQQAVEVSYSTLIKDMGLPAHLNFSMQEWPKVVASLDKLPDINQLVSTALQQREDLLAAEANLKSKEENIRAVRSQFWPTLTYNFDIGRTYFLRGLHDDYDYANIVSLDIPLFSGLSTLNMLRQAKAQKQQAKAQLRDTELRVIKEITTAHSNVKVSYETIGYANNFLESAEKQYQVALAKYKAGTNTILDVVTAQNSLAQARSTQASSIQQWYTSLSTLAYATGILSESYVETEESR